MDIVSKQQRSKMMAGIKAKDTKPELRVRKLLFSQGYRYRLHVKELPGNPDLVMRKHNLCVFVHGCYWHRHKSCKLAYTPKTRKQFWSIKLTKNVQRDIKNQSLLISRGWRILVVWECASRALSNQIFSKLLSDCIKTDVPYQELTIH